MSRRKSNTGRHETYTVTLEKPDGGTTRIPVQVWVALGNPERCNHEKAGILAQQQYTGSKVAKVTYP